MILSDHFISLNVKISAIFRKIAGHYGLGKLIAYYDANDAQISGKVSRSDTTDYAAFYKSNNWHVIEIDGHDRSAIRDAIRLAQMEVSKPSVIIFPSSN